MSPANPQLSSTRPTLAPALASGSELRPARALLTPLWLGALALLIVNDHWLKGAGLLPGALTGKLSDFAGLVVAPVLFGTLLRVRSRPALALCYFAVAAVFSAIQLSAVAAESWSALMGLVGMPWAITRDPSDLMALAVMPLAWRAFAPVLVREDKARLGLRRSATLAATGTGLAASVATSPPVDLEPWYPDVFATAYLHNASDSDLRVLLRPLRPEISLDCAAVAEDPGALLPDAAFGQGVLWELPARTTIAADEENGDPSVQARACRAVHVSGETIAPMILFWDAELEGRWIPGQILEEESAPSWGVALSEGDGQLYASEDTGPQLHWPISAAPTGGECVAPDETQRLDWAGLRTGSYELTAIDFGFDGCMRLDLATDTSEPESGYLCMPPEKFPFTTGERVSITRVEGDQGLRIAEAELAPGTDVGRELHLVRGGIHPAIAGANAAGRALSSCELAVDPDCPVAQRPAELLFSLGQQSAVLDAENPEATLEVDPQTQLELTFIFGADRSLLDTSCASGSTELGAEIEYLAVLRPAN